MALGFSFQLTPKQTELLLTCVFGRYRNCGEASSREGVFFLPDFSGDIVSTGKRLIDKGLMDHDNFRNPTWMATDAGRAMAKIIVGDARKIVAFEDAAKPVKAVLKKKVRK